ncbi:MAG TPA: hypothetical protein VGJ09_09935 [Bryobacteraceae bacterium]|jgi:tetratricopeptide (TPR) repeat protein
MKSSKFSTVMKWIGYGTAILSLVAGVTEVGKMVSEHLATGRKIDTLLSAEVVQLKGQDYGPAWQSLEQAAQIDPDSAPVKAAQETLAMDWLDNIHARENETFTDVAAKVEPVLTRGVASEKSPARQADMLAHVGWSYFLRSREGNFGLDPTGPYAEAVKKDPNNPYAQAMWGHWILWNQGNIAEAEGHFASAVLSHREQNYVRQLQLSALMNVHEDPYDEEVVRVANAIRKEQGSIDPPTRKRIFSTIYYFRMLPVRGSTPAFISAVPPADHVATFRWLFDTLELDDSQAPLRSYYLCALQEAAGQRDAALAGLKQIQQKIAGRSGSLLNAVEAGIKRLSGPA